MFDLVSGNPMIQLMDRSLTLASQRQTLIASNLANIDTPGYRTRDFDFEGALKAALSEGDGQQSPASMARTNPAGARPLIAAFALAALASGVIAWRFIFPVPVLFSAALLIALAVAFVAAGRAGVPAAEV